MYCAIGCRSPTRQASAAAAAAAAAATERTMRAGYSISSAGALESPGISAVYLNQNGIVRSVRCFPHHQSSVFASSMIGSLFILNDKGSVLFEKHYRRVSSRACCEDFWRMMERKAGEQVCFHAPSAPFPSTVAESLPHMLCSTAAPCCPRRLPCVPPPSSRIPPIA